MPIESAPPLLTSRAEMQKIISARGIDLRLDDDDDGVISSGLDEEASALNEVIIEASDEAYMRLENMYKPADLADSLWVRRRVTYIALHMLSSRRGNPKLYCDEFEKYIEQFERVIWDPTFQIPRVKKSHNFEPSVSNQIVDHRYTRTKLRVQRETSEGGFDGRQHLDFQGDFYFY